MLQAQLAGDGHLVRRAYATMQARRRPFEHVVDLDTQAIVAVNLGDANEGDTSSLPWGLLRAEMNLEAVATDPRAQRKLHERRLAEVVADKGYHSNEVLMIERPICKDWWASSPSPKCGKPTLEAGSGLRFVAKKFRRLRNFSTSLGTALWCSSNSKRTKFPRSC